MNKVFCILQILFFSFFFLLLVFCVYLNQFIHTLVNVASFTWKSNSSAKSFMKMLHKHNLYKAIIFTIILTCLELSQSLCPVKRKCVGWGGVGVGANSVGQGRKFCPTTDDETHGLHLPEAHLEILNSAATPSWSEKGKFCPGT